MDEGGLGGDKAGGVYEMKGEGLWFYWFWGDDMGYMIC